MTACPYPGLRPFRQDDAKFFFGREEHTEALLQKLWQNRFLAVTGPSGCGKSSLAYAGLLPALKDGFMLEAGENWRFAVLRPGASPMNNLATALRKALHHDNPDFPGMRPEEGGDGEVAAAFLKAALLRGPSRLKQVFHEARLPEETNPAHPGGPVRRDFPIPADRPGRGVRVCAIVAGPIPRYKRKNIHGPHHALGFHRRLRGVHEPARGHERQHAPHAPPDPRECPARQSIRP